MKRRLWLGLLLLLLGAPLGWAQNNQNVTIQYGIQIGPAHQATLTWTASTTSGITGYSIYRSVVSGSSYTKIATVGGSTLTYTDSGLPAGNTYFYVVTATSGNGESTFSNEVTANVPTP